MLQRRAPSLFLLNGDTRIQIPGNVGPFFLPAFVFVRQKQRNYRPSGHHKLSRVLGLSALPFTAELPKNTEQYVCPCVESTRQERLLILKSAEQLLDKSHSATAPRGQGTSCFGEGLQGETSSFLHGQLAVTAREQFEHHGWAEAE
ncbi:hypothetical protein AAFF_G00188150 [Aldrovandia affinis]|uniref:Uncharacterized protein n=1 Tax=Aldrovandia affinis TaxID=143900 RepID=A0AAD7SY77_9TELE|nr:hypothetical protein AAFF_G00188150 [Aldrovandia affinis]